ncbi:fungal-specific transcription factor domain-containing protein [Aspergillus aurantiobrunneus]
MDSTDYDSKDSEHSPPLLQLHQRRSRQSPGAACQECRRRKLRCDRKRPQCGLCAASGAVCQFKEIRPERARKKPNLDQLQQRMSALEEQLNLVVGKGFAAAGSPDVPRPTSAPDESIANTTSYARLDSPPPGAPQITPLMREELDQLYFDRVHPFAPMIHQGRYCTWAFTQHKTEAQQVLQYAMWSLAASLSAQCPRFGAQLYGETRRRFDALEVSGHEIDDIEIEHLQACLLLAIYEFLHSYYRRGWMRAGYAFRLVQLMRLFELDSPGAIPSMDWVGVEQKRRTFWVAFCLDRFLSIRNKWPLTLIEHLITTRLPSPEVAFQSGQPVVMDFLPEAISANGPVVTSPFTEQVIMATICGRALVHHHQALVEGNYASSIHNFHDRHNWIHGTLVQRLEILSPSRADANNPLLLFARMLGQTTILYLYRALELSAYEFDTMGIASLIEYDQIAVLAAQEMVSLTHQLSQLNSFKIHPFTPIPLCLCVDLFNAHRSPSSTFHAQLQEIFLAIQNFKCVNILGKKILAILQPGGDQDSAAKACENAVG